MNGRTAYFRFQYPRVRRLIADTARGRSIQRDVLLKHLRLCAESRFGADHGLAMIRSVEDFRRQVPITDFEYFRPYVEAVRCGKPDALFGPKARLLMFALTSGTTDKPKYIPVTDHFVRTYKHAWKLWGLQTHADHMDLLRKHYVHLTSDWQQSRTSSGVWSGNISGLAAETRPMVVRRPFIVPPQVGKIGDWTNRQYTALRLSLPSRRVGLIITANPLTLISLAQLADAQKESLLRDLRDGTLTLPNEGSEKIDHRLMRRIRRADRQRCRELEEIVSRTGHLLPREFWPELSVVAVWMGGPVSAFVPEVRRLYGDCAFRDHGLSASEGRMTIPMQDETNFGMLDYITNFFEFIPADEYGKGVPEVLESHELQEGMSYYILLTNAGGLFRYNINDVVRCVGFQGQIPLLEFLHKGTHCSSMAGEKLTEYQVATAVRDGFGAIHRCVETVLLVPVMGNPPGYVLLVEQELDEYGDILAERIDARLADLNCEYQDRLRTHRLRPLSMQKVPPGSWKRLRESKIASRGGSHEQYKHTFLATSEDVIHDLCGVTGAREGSGAQ